MKGVIELLKSESYKTKNDKKFTGIDRVGCDVIIMIRLTGKFLYFDIIDNKGTRIQKACVDNLKDFKTVLKSISII